MKTFKKEDMKFQKYIQVLFFLLVSAGMAGCIRDDMEALTVHEKDKGLTFTVTIPGHQIPTTRSMDGVPEVAITTIDLLLFDVNAKLIEHIKNEDCDISPLVDLGDYEITLVGVNLDPDTETVVMVANASAKMNSLGLAKNTTKADVLKALAHTSSGKWNATGSTDYTPIPMYGEAAIGDIGTTVLLTRMLARVDVANNADNFKVSEITVVNYNTQGNIAPAWGTDGKILKSGDSGYPYINNVNPPAPTVAGGWGKQIGGTLLYDGLSLEEGDKYNGEIYLYEAVKNPNAPMVEDDAHKEAICLIVKGKWAVDEKDYYYRIDFTAAQGALQKPEDVEYMPVYRNHLYTFTIEAVDGPGFPATTAGFESALKSFGVLNNLKTRLHTVDMSDIKYMVFNGQHYIGVEQTEIGVSNVAAVHKITIFTNAKDLKPTASSTGNWITNPTVQSLSGGKYTLTFNVGKNAVFESRPGKINVTAGRLNLTVDVTQDARQSIAPRFARSNIIMYVSGTNKILTFAETEADHTTAKSVKINSSTTVSVPAIPANAQGLHFRWAGLVGMSSSCNAQFQTAFNSSDVVFWPTEYTKPTGSWNHNDEPTGTDNMVPWGDVTTFPKSSFSTHDAFKTKYPTAGTVGYDAANGLGDICRYISDKGWVEGKWRMPTKDEFDQLVEETSVNDGKGITFGNFNVYTAMQNGYSNKYGYTPVPNGRILGFGVTTSDNAATHSTNPGPKRVVFPASGYRINLGGEMYEPGAKASYQSVTTVSGNIAENGNAAMLHCKTGLVSEAARVTAYSIRCLRE